MADLLGILRDLPPLSLALFHHPFVYLIGLIVFLPLGIHAFLCAQRTLEASLRPGLGGRIAAGAAVGTLPWLPLLLARPDLAWPFSCAAILTAAVAADRAVALWPQSLDGPDPGLAEEFIKMARRQRIAELEAVLADPGNTPAHTLRRLEAAEILQQLRRHPT